jgi:hypothetical protein
MISATGGVAGGRQQQAVGAPHWQGGEGGTLHPPWGCQAVPWLRVGVPVLGLTKR